MTCSLQNNIISLYKIMKNKSTISLMKIISMYFAYIHCACNWIQTFEFRHQSSRSHRSSGVDFQMACHPSGTAPQPLRPSPPSASCRCAEELWNFCAESSLRHENKAGAAELRVVIDGKIGRKGSSVISRQPAGRKKLTGWWWMIQTQHQK